MDAQRTCFPENGVRVIQAPCLRPARVLPLAGAPLGARPTLSSTRCPRACLVYLAAAISIVSPAGLHRAAPGSTCTLDCITAMAFRGAARTGVVCCRKAAWRGAAWRSRDLICLLSCAILYS